VRWRPTFILRFARARIAASSAQGQVVMSVVEEMKPSLKSRSTASLEA
jgi:hypothetical protein